MHLGRLAIWRWHLYIDSIVEPVHIWDRSGCGNFARLQNRCQQLQELEALTCEAHAETVSDPQMAKRSLDIPTSNESPNARPGLGQQLQDSDNKAAPRKDWQCRYCFLCVSLNKLFSN